MQGYSLIYLSKIDYFNCGFYICGYPCLRRNGEHETLFYFENNDIFNITVHRCDLGCLFIIEGLKSQHQTLKKNVWINVLSHPPIHIVCIIIRSKYIAQSSKIESTRGNHDKNIFGIIWAQGLNFLYISCMHSTWAVACIVILCTL